MVESGSPQGDTVDERVKGRCVIGLGNGCQHPTVIAQAHVEAPVLAQPVRRGVAGGARGRDIDENLEQIEVVGGLDTEEFITPISAI